MKTCSRCNNNFPDEAFAMKHRVSNVCPECRRAYNRERYAARKGGSVRPLHKIKTDPVTGVKTKICPSCLMEKPTSEYARRGKGIQSKCKICGNLETRRLYWENPEKYRLASKNWADRNKDRCQARWKEYRDTHREELLAYYRSYNETHRGQKRATYRRMYWARTPEQRRAKNRREYLASREYHLSYNYLHREQRRAYEAQWKRENLDKHAAKERRRNLKISMAVKERIDRAAIIQRDGSACYLCGLALPDNSVTLDHVIPIARGGTHTADNLRVCCQRCNSRKGTKLLSELSL